MTNIPPLDPRLTDKPIGELEDLISPTLARALRQCGAKTIGEAHAALISGRLRKYPGIGAQRERALADVLAFKSGLAARPSIAELAQRALDELDARPGIADPIDWNREFGGKALRDFAGVAKREARKRQFDFLRASIGDLDPADPHFVYDVRLLLFDIVDAIEEG